MRVCDLIKAFADHDEFPIKPVDVARCLIEAGIEEEITFIGVDLDIPILRGFIVQTTETRGVYDSAGNGRISKIYYGSNQDIEWQRLVCCKELLHILDHEVYRTETREQVTGLIKKIILPPAFQSATEPSDGDGAQALFDRVGALQAAAVLFPIAVRDLLLPYYHPDGILTDDEIVRMVGIPQIYVRMVMSEFWPNVYQHLCKI